MSNKDAFTSHANKRNLIQVHIHRGLMTSEGVSYNPVIGSRFPIGSTIQLCVALRSPMFSSYHNLGITEVNGHQRSQVKHLWPSIALYQFSGISLGVGQPKHHLQWSCNSLCLGQGPWVSKPKSQIKFQSPLKIPRFYGYFTAT